MTDFDYCEGCGRRPPDVVLYQVRVRGAVDFTFCLKCRVRHGAEVIQ